MIIQRHRRPTQLIGIVLLALIILAVYKATPSTKPTAQGPILQVVAGENFWGSLVSQIGGNKVHVNSIVSDPNADPHEYESNNTDARNFANANYVILNGAGYDSWGDKLLAASPSKTRLELNVATLLGKRDGDNPHFWYNPAYVNTVIAKMTTDLSALAPKDSSYFQQQLKVLKSSLSQYQGRISSIREQFGGTKVAATEDIFVYLAQASDLDLVSPPAFIEAVAEGNDPPINSVTDFEQQLQSGSIKVLVYNQQTVTPLTDNIKKLAADNNIPVIGVTETVQPPNTSFQDWMNAELIELQNALNSNALGQ
jgi:zinc/manganese transport system substrate-binding protein